MSDEPTDLITVKDLNLETGEITDRCKVPADHFACKLPVKPKDPTDKKAVAEFWEAHASILTREEKRSISGGSSHVVRPAEHPPAWEKGDVLVVSTNLSAEVLSETRTLDGLATKFRVEDLRPLLMKQRVGGGSRPRVDEHGYASDLTPAEQERARLDGAYTRSPHLAVPGTDDVMDDKIHQRLHAEAQMKGARSSARRRRKVTLDEMKARRDLAKSKHRRGEVRYMERQIASLEAKEEKRA